MADKGGGSKGSGRGEEARNLGKKIIHEKKRDQQRKDGFRDEKDKK